MSKKTMEKVVGEIESAIVEPMRAYGSLTTEYFARLLDSQFDAARTVTKISLGQSRRWAGMKDPISPLTLCEDQQRAIQAISECLQDDAETLVDLNQEYLGKFYKLNEESMQNGQKLARDNTQLITENLKDSQHFFDDTLPAGEP
ncbi:phasin family protein [Halomonas sp. TRM85114]|uniref:phasin family protein n=1 Tax=Halomonas jincaotanensis TaxID=2810616 RepID=UPI001BD55EA1|nr:phasin family protein [Halomonas jincaotanensis]MBS9404728.1 phasin family protein [Halomonas jincaotanensis]